MRKIILIIFLTAIFVSCNDRLEEMNQPTKAAVEVPAEPLFTNGLNEMFYMMNNSDANINVFRLYAQYWAQTTYPDESQYNMAGRRNPDNFWRSGFGMRYKISMKPRELQMRHGKSYPFQKPLEITAWQLSIFAKCTRMRFW